MTLGLSFAGLTVSSVDLISAIGFGGAVTCMFTVSANLTLLPALLFLLGPWLSTGSVGGSALAAQRDLNLRGGEAELQPQPLQSGADETGAAAADAMNDGHPAATQTMTRGRTRSLSSASASSSAAEASLLPMSAFWVRVGEFCRHEST